MLKKNYLKIKIQILSGEANPGPPIGPILGQRGINIIEFCKLFNSKTSNLEKGLLIPTIITIYSDKSFSFIIKNPPVSILLKKKLKLDSGSSNPKSKIISKIGINLIKEISMLKITDMNTLNLDSAIKSVIGTAKSMGIDIIY